VPEWEQRGEGYFIATASAAGLLTQIGDAPYSVSKHACVAFAEWLAVTYGSRGIRVSCICPMGVDTPLFRDGLGGRGEEDLATEIVAAAGRVLSAGEVADHVLEALRQERFLVLPHPEVREFMTRKANDHDRWIQGMQRLQRHVEASMSNRR
jgi:NAD(P)-dependent dehydrogenase (short-subunit alcohol dehydrogenase family)